MKQSAGFLGTYFERDAVLRLERWARWTAWGVLAAYMLDAGYTAFQSVYGAISGGYPLDWYFVFITLTRVLQGGVLFILMQVAGKVLLILLDIEDNSRRAVRANIKDI